MAMWSTDRLRAGAALGCLLLLASACAHAPPPVADGRDAHALTPLDQYPVRAVEREEHVELAVHARGVLSPAQEAALAGFARTWREGGGVSAVIVQHPAAAGPDGRLSAQAAADRLVALGVPAAALRVGPYDSGPEPGAPVLARFDTLAADAPDCSRGWDNLVATQANDVSGHFGCATARNFAVMLADPRDLQGPRAITPADAGRRAAVLDAYRKGQMTSSAKDEQASGAISQKVR